MIGKAKGYFKMVNDQGGINGRQVNLITLDDGYIPPKCVEQSASSSSRTRSPACSTRWARAQHGDPKIHATRRRCRSSIVSTGAAKFSDPEHFPWTMGYKPNYQTEARIYAKHILQQADAKIGVLYQNDGFGKDYLIGLKAGLGAEHAGMIVKEASYETTSRPSTARSSGCRARAPTSCSSPRRRNSRRRRSARRRSRLGGVRYVSNVSLSIATVLKPAGLEKSKGLITAVTEGCHRPRWKEDADIKTWKDFCDKYMSQGDFPTPTPPTATRAAVMTQVLKQCGDDLSRDNILAQAASLKDLRVPLMLPGQTLNTSPTNTARSPDADRHLRRAELGITRRLITA